MKNIELQKALKLFDDDLELKITDPAYLDIETKDGIYITLLDHWDNSEIELEKDCNECSLKDDPTCENYNC